MCKRIRWHTNVSNIGHVDHGKAFRLIWSDQATGTAIVTDELALLAFSWRLGDTRKTLP